MKQGTERDIKFNSKNGKLDEGLPVIDSEPGDEWDEKLLVEEELAAGNDKKPITLRILALFVTAIFIGFVFLASLPGLKLPPLDFIGQSVSLKKDPIVEQLLPAVVRINVLCQRSDSPASFLSAERKSGTGFNIRPEGLIITNYHIIKDAVSMTVSFPDGKTYNAVNWKGKPEVDLAVVNLKVGEWKEKELPYVSLNLRNMTRPGDEVIIVGNPLGIENTVSKGTVGSYVRIPNWPVPVFEIDAPIHPGSSGSPVFDDNQKVVGVVFGNIRYKKRGEYVTRGLAVPAKEAANLY